MCAQVNLLVQIKRSIQALLQSAFERYTNLCDNSASTSTACGGAEGQVNLVTPVVFDLMADKQGTVGGVAVVLVPVWLAAAGSGCGVSGTSTCAIIDVSHVRLPLPHRATLVSPLHPTPSWTTTGSPHCRCGA